MQRALGTLNNYWIEIQFPEKEEPKGLGTLISQVLPMATRYFMGNWKHLMSRVNYGVEATFTHLELFAKELTKLIQQENYHHKNQLSWICVYETIDGKNTHITNIRIQ